jgi:cytochrome c556
VLAFAGLTMPLAACGGEAPAAYHGDDPLSNGMTVKQQIEARQHNLKDLGGAYKAVNDQLKNDAPQLTEIKLAAQEIKSHSQEIANWFPKGTGPESGVKTEALAAIWAEEASFKAKAQKFDDEAAKLNDVVAVENIEAIKVQAKATGEACKGCHDNFRQKKD